MENKTPANLQMTANQIFKHSK